MNATTPRVMLETDVSDLLTEDPPQFETPAAAMQFVRRMMAFIATSRSTHCDWRIIITTLAEHNIPAAGSGAVPVLTTLNEAVKSLETMTAWFAKLRKGLFSPRDDVLDGVVAVCMNGDFATPAADIIAAALKQTHKGERVTTYLTEWLKKVIANTPAEAVSLGTLPAEGKVPSGAV